LLARDLAEGITLVENIARVLELDAVEPAVVSAVWPDVARKLSPPK